MFDLNDICAADRRMQRHDDDGWVTINGTHVMVSGGKATGGACGSKLSGYDFSSAKSTKSNSTNGGSKKLTSVEEAMKSLKKGDRIRWNIKDDIDGDYSKMGTVTGIDKKNGYVNVTTDDDVKLSLDKWSFQGENQSFDKVGGSKTSSKKPDAFTKKTVSQLSSYNYKPKNKGEKMVTTKLSNGSTISVPESWTKKIK